MEDDKIYDEWMSPDPLSQPELSLEPYTELEPGVEPGVECMKIGVCIKAKDEQKIICDWFHII